MKKQLSNFVLGLALLSPVLGFSQNDKIQPCNTYAAMEAHFAAEPQARKNYEAAQALLMKDATANALNKPNVAGKTAAIQYTIPVVFHILHMGGPENISDQQCIDALEAVNKDFARAGADTASIFTPFKNLYINCDIKMMLAKKDPNGNCTNGIVRHYDTKTNWEQGPANSTSYWTYTWAPTKYLNLYIVASIASQGTVTGGGYIVGYTHKPGAYAAGDVRDGIVYRSDKLGVGNYDYRSLSHEMGHWYNLDHTFGPTNNPGVSCGDDGIGDTPPTKGNFSTCPASSTNTNILCSSGQTPYYQNVENIMDYSSCAKNFTAGQTNMMHTVLNASVAGRNNLWSATNIAFTDVNGVIPCAPVADFLSTTNSYTVCSGGSLTMKDFSYNGVITNYMWTANQSAMAATPTSSITSIVFPVVGLATVSLTVSNAQGSSSTTKLVTVISGQAANDVPAVESFETPGVPNHWSVVNNDANTSEWQWTGDAAKDGAASFYVEGLNANANNEDYLVLPLLNLQYSTDKTLNFAYAYAKATSTQNDQLKIQASKDCGGTWTDIAILPAGTMAQGSGGTTNTPFIPSLSEWKTYTISTQIPWQAFINLPSVLVRFNFIEGSVGHGNNMFIDAMKVAGPVGMNELAKNIGLNVYPNPSASEVTVNFKLDDAAAVTMNVVDIYGRNILPAVETNFAPGEHSLSINKDGKLASGIYFINMNVNGTKVSSKMIIE